MTAIYDKVGQYGMVFTNIRHFEIYLCDSYQFYNINTTMVHLPILFSPSSMMTASGISSDVWPK